MKFQIEPKLAEWFEKSSVGWTHNARVITKSWLKDGLRSRCITRDLKWGIPVPLDSYRNKVRGTTLITIKKCFINSSPG